MLKYIEIIKKSVPNLTISLKPIIIKQLICKQL